MEAAYGLFMLKCFAICCYIGRYLSISCICIYAYMFPSKLMSGLVRVLVEKIWQPPTMHMLHLYAVYNIAMSEKTNILIKQLWGLYATH